MIQIYVLTENLQKPFKFRKSQTYGLKLCIHCKHSETVILQRTVEEIIIHDTTPVFACKPQKSKVSLDLWQVLPEYKRVTISVHPFGPKLSYSKL